MPISDDVRRVIERTVDKALADRTPLYLVAGAGDLALEKLKELPGRVAATRQDYRLVPARTAALALAKAIEFNVRAAELFEELTRRGQGVVDGRLGEPEPTDPWSSATRASRFEPDESDDDDDGGWWAPPTRSRTAKSGSGTTPRRTPGQSASRSTGQPSAKSAARPTASKSTSRAAAKAAGRKSASPPATKTARKPATRSAPGSTPRSTPRRPGTSA